MASLYIKDGETAALAADLATRLSMTKTSAVRDALRHRLADLNRTEEPFGLSTRMAAWRKANPLSPPTGLKADRAFFDWLSGEEDVHDPFS